MKANTPHSEEFTTLVEVLDELTDYIIKLEQLLPLLEKYLKQVPKSTNTLENDTILVKYFDLITLKSMIENNPFKEKTK